MAIVVQVLTYEGERIVPPLTSRFGAGGGTIGRGDRATLKLADPKRSVSREQARVLVADGRVWIDNIGSGNAIHVGGRPVAAGSRTVLADGDIVEMGAYRLSVQLEVEADDTTRVEGSGPITAGSPAASLAARSTLEKGLTDRPSIPAELDTASIEAEIHARNQAAAQSRRVGAAATLPAIDVPATEVRAFLPPAPPLAAPVDAAGQAAADALWQAFIKGVGVAVEQPERVRPQLMTTLGTMVRTMVDGLRELVQLRARAKAEFNAERTQIKRRDNNPLKFSRDTDVALKALLSPPRTGFMPGPAAIEDALKDLQVHQNATMAGMRAAHEALIAQFTPERIERRLSGGRLLDALVPSRRSAQLWELYVAQFRAMQQEASAHSDEVFQRAFLDAYERETA